MNLTKTDYLRRARLNCRVGRSALEGSVTPPQDDAAKTHYALYCIIGAIDELAAALEEEAANEK